MLVIEVFVLELDLHVLFNKIVGHIIYTYPLRKLLLNFDL